MKFSPLYLAVILLIAVWALYFLNFNDSFSSDQGVWGTFGDFTGGVLNPLLSFITIYLLITQYVESKKDLETQRNDEAIKAFENSFFMFTTIALNEFKSYEITIKGTAYKSASAVGAIENYVEETSKANLSVYDKFNELDQSQNDSIYSLASTFCVVFKLIEESCPPAARDKYLNLFSMLLPTKITYLLCVSEAATKWMILKYPRDLWYFRKNSVAKVLDHYKTMTELKTS